MNWLMVAVGGVSGALSRYALMVIFEDVTRKTAFPWVILGVNIIGSLLAGFVFAVAHERQWLSIVVSTTLLCFASTAIGIVIARSI